MHRSAGFPFKGQPSAGFRRTLLLVALTGASMLIGGASAAADATERVSNGGFETGETLFEAPPWSFTDANVCTVACGGAPASGSRYASTGFTFDGVPAMASNNAIGSFRQEVVVPEGPATLSFKYRFVDSPDAAGMELLVTLGGTQLLEISTFTASFQPAAISVPPGLIGSTRQTLEFDVRCWNFSGAPIECDRIDVDDVSLITGSPPPPPPPPPPSSPPADTEITDAKLNVKKVQRQGKKVKIKAKASAGETVDLLAKGKIKVKGQRKAIKLKPQRKSAEAEQTVKLVLKPAKRKEQRKVLRALRAGKKVVAKISVRFSDAADNARVLKAKTKLR